MSTHDNRSYMYSQIQSNSLNSGNPFCHIPLHCQNFLTFRSLHDSIMLSIDFTIAVSRLYPIGDLPPIHTLFSDEEGRIYAVTFERGDQQGEYWCDIFNQEGIFIARISLPVQFSRTPFPIYVLVKNQYLYCVGEKDNGYQQLKVFRMDWN